MNEPTTLAHLTTITVLRDGAATIISQTWNPAGFPATPIRRWHIPADHPNALTAILTDALRDAPTLTADPIPDATDIYTLTRLPNGTFALTRHAVDPLTGTTLLRWTRPPHDLPNTLAALATILGVPPTHTISPLPLIIDLDLRHAPDES